MISNMNGIVGNTVGGGQIISRSHQATGLMPIVYTVLVTDKATGCTFIVSEEVPDQSVIPAGEVVTTDLLCSDSNSGAVSASVGGETTGYTFEWFDGTGIKPTADYTGSTVNGLAAGSYTLLVTNATQCTWDTTVVLNQTLPPVIDAVASTDNTSCEPTLYNGTVSVTFSGNPADYTVEWFRGQNTLANNKVGDGESLTGLRARWYTVLLTDINTGCTATERVRVRNNLTIPNLSAAPTPATLCGPFNGEVTATVDVGDVGDYTFFWYDGPAVKAGSGLFRNGKCSGRIAPW